MPTRREVLSVLLAGAGCAAADTGWIDLIPGDTLAGWRAEGKADWSVRNRTIVGRQGPNGEAGDLFTQKQWGNFELEAEWSMHFPGNSGIWFRVSKPGTGYQADILDQPSNPGILSGSLYCMGKAFLAENRDPSTVNRDGWNTVRIRAAGEEITVEQNGKQVVRVHDGTFKSGSIGIQVHQGKEFDGMEIRVRKLRIRPL